MVAVISVSSSLMVHHTCITFGVTFHIYSKNTEDAARWWKDKHQLQVKKDFCTLSPNNS